MRQSTIRILGGPASKTKTVFARDEVELEDQTGFQKLQLLEVSSCDNSHAFQGNVEIAGTCAICGKWLCTTPGCAFTCAAHGHIVCGRHAFQSGDRVLCSKHRLLHGAVALARAIYGVSAAILRPVFGVIGAILRNYTGFGPRP